MIFKTKNLFLTIFTKNKLNNTIKLFLNHLITKNTIKNPKID